MLMQGGGTGAGVEGGRSFLSHLPQAPGIQTLENLGTGRKVDQGWAGSSWRQDLA